MLIPPAIAPIIKGREHTETGIHALAGASESDSNPNKRHAPAAHTHFETSEEAQRKETPTSSRLIDRSPISSATQAALLALLSEPGGANSFEELVEEATIEQSAADGEDS